MHRQATYSSLVPVLKRRKVETDQVMMIDPNDHSFSLYISTLLKTYTQTSHFNKETIYKIQLGEKIVSMQLTQPMQQITINPCELKDTDHAILSQVILSHGSQEAKKKYPFTNNRAYKIHLMDDDNDHHLIFCRLQYCLAERDVKVRENIKENSIQGRHFEVHENKKIGKGCFGTVYRSIGTLIFTPENKFFYKNKFERVIKYFHHEVKFKDIKKEAFLSSKLPHLNAKPIQSRALVMDYIPEKDLSTIIIENLDSLVDHDKPLLTLKERFMYSIAICEAVHKEMHTQGLINRDLKPDNIRVAKKDNQIIAHVLDAGLAILKSARVKEAVGARLYRAPEIHAKMDYDERCDSYSLARIIAEIFGADTIFITEASIKKEYESGMNFDNVFDGLNDEEQDDCEELLPFLSQMGAVDPATRPTAGEAAEALKKIYLAIENQMIAPLKAMLETIHSISRRHENLFTQNPSLLVKKSLLEKLINLCQNEQAFYDKTLQIVPVELISDEEMILCKTNKDLKSFLHKYEKRGMLPLTFILAKNERAEANLKI